MTRLVVALALLAACGSRSEKSAPGPAPDAAAVPVAVPDAAPAAATAPTKAQHADYRRHLGRGRRMAEQQKWGEAVLEFQGALIAIPHDGRALSELGWAAFNAGDFDQARRANGESVLLALDPKVKAASLYNLGRVEEATGDKERAAALYRQSLALRPSKAVEARLAGLAGDSDDSQTEDERFCTDPLPLADLCACIDSYAGYWDKLSSPGDRSCRVQPAGAVDGVRVIDAVMSQDLERHLLAADGPGGWTVVAVLADVYNPGAMGIEETWALDAITEEPLGDRRILKVTSSQHRHDSDTGIYEEESLDTTWLTVCVRGDAKTRTTCPLGVPIEQTYLRERFVADKDLEPEELAFLKESGTPGLPIKRATELRVDLASDGGANVVLVKGSGEHLSRLVGPKRLW